MKLLDRGQDFTGSRGYVIPHVPPNLPRPVAEKEDLENTDRKLDELREQRNKILSEYASKNNLVHELIDLALLANGMLKGEALSRFIRRSVQLIG